MYLQTSDGVKIAYDWYLSASSGQMPRGYLVLIHMMPTTKESWRGFVAFAQKQGYSSIAIDLRGHGESDGGPAGYQNFSDEEHQKSMLDLQAAVDFLRKQGATPAKISFIGASIGANLSLQYIVEHQEFKTAILLSPGLDYRGIKTEPLVKKLSKGQKIMFVSARDDDRSGGNNADMNELLASLVPAGITKKLMIYDSGGHGTNILESQSELQEKVVGFLNS